MLSNIVFDIESYLIWHRFHVTEGRLLYFLYECLDKHPYEDWEMFTGESMDPEGSLAYMNYREDGITPYIWLFLDGLDQEKV